jgi:hypothetical protein
VTAVSLLRRVRTALRPPPGHAPSAPGDVFATVEAIGGRSRKAVTYCEECGSRRIVTRWPDGSAGYLPGHPDHPPDG